jgi:DNA-directed RNA polymerase subunit RPC12/RpoP
MSIQFRCPSCQTQLSISNDKAGSIVDCPRCRNKITIPLAALPVHKAQEMPVVKQTANDPFSFIKPEPLRDRKPQRGTKTTNAVSVKIACPFCGNKGKITDGSKLKPLKCPRCGTRFHPKPPASTVSDNPSSYVHIDEDHAIDVNAVVSQLPVNLGITVSNTYTSVYNPNRKRHRINIVLAVAGMTILVCSIAGWLLTGLTSVPVLREVFLSKEQKAIERWIHIIPTFNPDTDKVIRWYPAQNIKPADTKHLGADCVIRVKFRCSSLFGGPTNGDYLFYMKNGKIDAMDTVFGALFDDKNNMFKLYFPDEWDF